MKWNRLGRYGRTSLLSGEGLSALGTSILQLSLPVAFVGTNSGTKNLEVFIYIDKFKLTHCYIVGTKNLQVKMNL